MADAGVFYVHIFLILTFALSGHLYYCVMKLYAILLWTRTVVSAQDGV